MGNPGGQQENVLLADEVGKGRMWQCLRVVHSQSSSSAALSSLGASACRRGPGQQWLEGVSGRARGEEQHQAKIITFFQTKKNRA